MQSHPMGFFQAYLSCYNQQFTLVSTPLPKNYFGAYKAVPHHVLAGHWGQVLPRILECQPAPNWIYNDLISFFFLSFQLEQELRVAKTLCKYPSRALLAIGWPLWMSLRLRRKVFESTTIRTPRRLSSKHCCTKLVSERSACRWEALFL